MTNNEGEAVQTSKETHVGAGISSIFRSSIPEIIVSWIKQVRSQIPAAGAQDDHTLINGLPAFLASLTNVISTTALSQGGERYVNENRENCRRHGTARSAIPSYTLDQVIGEYKILRQVIFNVLEAKQPLTNKEESKILEAIDCGITEAACEFALLRGFSDARLKISEDARQTIENQLAESNSEIEELKKQREIREEFVALLSHDLRTPLTAAKVSAELILKRVEVEDPTHKLARRIVNNIDRTDHMIRDLLDANRICAGERLTAKLECVDLVSITKLALQDFEEMHGSRFCLNTIPEAIGHWNASDIRRVIENLVTNAIKYGNPFSPITLSIRKEAQSVVLTVHNEGNPIPPEIQHSLFQYHKRATSVQQSGRKGWGLGLTLVQGIAQAHSGSVCIESDEKRGTSFIVTLPSDPRTIH